MQNIVKNTGKTCSIPKGMAIVTILDVGITFLLLSLVAIFIHTERITWEQAGYWIMGILFFAAFSGGKCAYSIIKRQPMIVALMSGMLYLGMLLCITALFFGGDYSAVLETAGVILAGSCSSALLHLPVSKNSSRKRGGNLVKLNKKFIR